MATSALRPKYHNIQYSLAYLQIFLNHVRTGNVVQATRMMKLYPELVNVSSRLDSRKTVLMEAMSSTKATEMIALLLSKGAQLNEVNAQMEDAVMYACSSVVDVNFLCVLLSAWVSVGGYDWSLQNAEGKTAFVSACESRSISFVLQLLDFMGELSRTNGVAVFKLLRKRITNKATEGDLVHLISHPVVKSLITKLDSWALSYPLGLRELSVGFASTSIPTAIVDCFLRSLEYGLNTFAHTLDEIHPKAIRAIAFTAILTADRRYIIPPILFTDAEQFYCDFKWAGARQAFLIRHKSNQWNLVASIPDDLFRVVVRFMEEPWDQEKVIRVLTYGNTSPWRLVTER